ncbi:MAG: hypothetical protein KDD67_11830 [Ignavibacteriae bacterium]|nr:hypothetical protein [Ignavibacteriota bacterium]MCB9214937.1 hypothetical protein [Ignavibacteria bacterium]
MNRKTLVKIGGVSGIVLGVVQLAGIIMHGSIPVDLAEGLAFVENHPAWALTHILLITSYLVIISFYVGFRASFDEEVDLPALEIGANLTLVGAILGAVHFIIHFALYPYFAAKYQGLQGSANGENVLTFYMSVHHYAHLLNRCSLFLLMIVACIFALSMLRVRYYKRWIGILGTVSSLVTIVAVAISEIFLPRSTGDIVFAIALLPTIVWIVAVGISMLKLPLPQPLTQAG